MLEIELLQISEKRKLYENTNLIINPGITALIGKNGSGKTYACHQIKEKYPHAYLVDIVQETKINYSSFREDKSIGRWFNASERTTCI